MANKKPQNVVGRSKDTKIKSQKCRKIRKFLKRQCDQMGRGLADVLSQSLSRREVRMQIILCLIEFAWTIFCRLHRSSNFNQSMSLTKTVGISITEITILHPHLHLNDFLKCHTFHWYRMHPSIAP